MTAGLTGRIAGFCALLATGTVLAESVPARAVSPTNAPVKSSTNTLAALVSPPPLELPAKPSIPDREAISDEAASQLKGLCSLAEFHALPEIDRHVYSFDVWPSEKDELGGIACLFRFHLGSRGVPSQGITFAPSGGGPGGPHSLVRVKDVAAARSNLAGFGNLSWSGVARHVFTFTRPVLAFGVVLKSSGDLELRKFYWPSAKENGYPVSYTLTDGSVVQLGAREVRGALLKGGTNAFVGVIDRSGRGIVSVTYTIRGLAGNKTQTISMSDWAFATAATPATAPVINLRSRCDFADTNGIAGTPAPTPAGLMSLADFRFIAGTHRYVYSFDTWPEARGVSKTGVLEFPFDLKGKGAVGQPVTVAVSNSAQDAQPAPVRQTGSDGLAYRVLGGLGDIGRGGWSEQTFRFKKPVWAFGVTYRSPADVALAYGSGKPGAAPVSYTLSDGTVVNVGSQGVPAGVASATGKTFVGVMDDTDKGIASVTFRVKGTANGPQSLTIEDLAFALAGPPPGEWTLTMHDEFDMDKLNPANWTPGYTFKEVINSELQGYVPENISVSNGICTIKVELRDCRNTDRNGKTGATQKFASGAFTSFDRFTQTYGYFEARVKMTKAPGPGTWPAFWMLPDRGRDYPEPTRRAYLTKDYGRGIEIDIFEFMPWWKTLEGRFYTHVGCIWSYGKVTEQDPAPHGHGGYALANDGWGPEELTYPDADTRFHTYGLYWSPERLIFYLDSKPVFRVKDPKHVPDVPHYFLFNVALSGNGWGKSPDKKHPAYQQIVDGMPNRMEIDYFRAYSGVLEEAVPASPTDLPTIRHTYTPPPKGGAVQKPAPVSEPAAPATNGVPPAPANSEIKSAPTG